MEKVSKKLGIGSHEEETFTYKGLRVSTIRNGPNKPFEIVLDGDYYLASTAEMMTMDEDDEMFYLHLNTLNTAPWLVRSLMSLESFARTWPWKLRLCPDI